MAIITYPLNNIEYSAEDAELFHCTRTSGVFSADNEFVATATGTDNNVTIGTGIAWIRNSKFSGKVVANKTPVVLDMGIANGTYSRIDAIVIQFDANANKTSIIVKKGAAASNPVPPQVVRTEALYELHIYHVRRPAGATAVYASNITDLRENKAYCGVMFDDVTIADGDRFMDKATYDPAGAVESAGGIPNYVANNSPKVALSSSVTSTSTTTAANSYAVKQAYDRAEQVAKSQKVNSDYNLSVIPNTLTVTTYNISTYELSNGITIAQMSINCTSSYQLSTVTFTIDDIFTKYDPNPAIIGSISKLLINDGIYGAKILSAYRTNNDLYASIMIDDINADIGDSIAYNIELCFLIYNTI